MYLMIDNYDSFVYNLACYFRELGREITVIRNDEANLEELSKIANLEGIILSPGPGRPEESGICKAVLEEYADRCPVLGVCLGHQIICDAYGVTVKRGSKPMHGKVTGIETNRRNLFYKLPANYKVIRYHSLAADPEAVNEELLIDAVSEDGAIMAVSHKEYPVYGVQFHPEAVLTEYGHDVIRNFIRICEKWSDGTWELQYGN